MKRTLNFFLRFDIIQKACTVLVIFFLFCLYITASWKFDATRTVLLVLGAILSAVGCTFKTPKAGEITDYLVKHRAENEKDVMKDNKLYRTYEWAPLYAFDKEKERLARTVGSRLLYPVCLNMMFVKHPDGVCLVVENLSLFERRKPSHTEYTFGKKDSFIIKILPLEGDAEMLLVTLLNGETEALSFYVRDDHLWKQFLNYINAAATVITEET